MAALIRGTDSLLTLLCEILRVRRDLLRVRASQMVLIPSCPRALSDTSSRVMTLFYPITSAMALQPFCPILFLCIPSELLSTTLIIESWVFSISKKGMQLSEVRLLLPRSIWTRDAFWRSPLSKILSPESPMLFFERSSLAKWSLHFRIELNTFEPSTAIPRSRRQSFLPRIFFLQYS